MLVRMTTLKSTLQEDLTEAIRARDELRSSTLRLTLTAITKEEVAGEQSRELSDDEVLKVIAREAKKRREAAEAFDRGGRAEQAERERAEGRSSTRTCRSSCRTTSSTRSWRGPSRRRRRAGPRGCVRWAP